MKRKVMMLSVLGAGAVVALVAQFAPFSAGAAGPGRTNAERIQALLEEMGRADLDALPALPVERLKLPSASVDVMRARVEETYTIDGVGTDTVQLHGWIAVVHDNARPIEGEEEIAWGKAVMDTEFVGLDLRGESKVFGPVHVTLDTTQNNRGQVGEVELPADAAAALEKLKAPGHLLVDMPAQDDKGAKDQAPVQPKEKKKTRLCNPACNCSAAASVNILMRDLDLRMATAHPVHMYSKVETIPPVGYSASISLTPTPLISAGRKVGVLTHAEVKFREIVRKVELRGSSSVARR